MLVKKRILKDRLKLLKEHITDQIKEGKGNQIKGIGAEDQSNESEEQIVSLKTIKLDLETDLQNQKLHPLKCYACESSNDCNKKYNMFASYRKEETLNETEMRQIMERYSKVKRARIKLVSYDYQQH